MKVPLILIVMTGFAFSVFSQDTTFTVTASRKICNPQQTVEINYTVNISDTKKSNFIRPDFGRLNVDNYNATFKTTSVINGETIATSGFTFYVSAWNPGEYTITPAGYVTGGDTLYCEPVTIQVTGAVVKKSIQPDDLFFRIEVDKQKGNLNDTFNITCKLFSAIDDVDALRSYTSIPDYVYGEDHVLLDKEQQLGDTVINDKAYRVLALRKWIWFPLKPGKIAAGPVTLPVKVSLDKNGRKPTFPTPADYDTITLQSNSLMLEIDTVSVLTSSGMRAELTEMLASDKREELKTQTQGVDIIFLVDGSASMLMQDFGKGRLKAIKKALFAFTGQSKIDSIGVNSFTFYPDIICSPTSNYSEVKSAIKLLSTDSSSWNYLSVGLSLLKTVIQLQENDGEKIIVLITDGMTNDPFISSFTSADFAGRSGIKIFTIGIGGEGKAIYPYKESSFQKTATFSVDPTKPRVNFSRTENEPKIVYRETEIPLDETILQNIAAISGGKYFRARNEAELKQAVIEIRKLL